jgi:hypothetical protein
MQSSPFPPNEIVMLSTVLLTSCSIMKAVMETSGSGLGSGLGTDPETAISKDGKYQVDVPGNWDIDSLRLETDDADLSLTKGDSEAWFTVWLYDKEDYEFESLQEFADYLNDIYLIDDETTKNMAREPQVSFNEGNYPMLVVEANYTFERYNRTAWAFSLEAETAYVYIFGETIRSQQSTNKRPIHDIAASFKIIREGNIVVPM